MSSIYENGFTKYKNWVKENNIYVDLRETEYDFLWIFFNLIKPKKVLSIGGYTNLDAIFSCKDLDDCSIVNIDHLLLDQLDVENENEDEVRKKQELIIEKTNYKGKYKWINDTFDPTRVFEERWDVIWEGVLSTKVYNIPTTSIYIKYIYSNPRAFLETLPAIDKLMPIQILSKSFAIFGDIGNICNERNDLHFQSHIEWPFGSEKRLVPIVEGTSLNNAEFGNWNST